MLRLRRIGDITRFSCRTVESAVAAFEPSHPYLLFRKDEIGRIRNASRKNRKVSARLHAALRETKRPASVESGAREEIKRRARRLINTSFLAMIEDGDECLTEKELSDFSRL